MSQPRRSNRSKVWRSPAKLMRSGSTIRPGLGRAPGGGPSRAARRAAESRKAWPDSPSRSVAVDGPLEPRERLLQVAVGRRVGAALGVLRVEQLAELVRQGLGPRVRRRVLVEDPLLPGLDGLAQGRARPRAGGGRRGRGAARGWRSSPTRERSTRRPCASERPSRKGPTRRASRSRSACAALPGPGVRAVEVGAVGRAVDLDPALRPAALRADGLALGGAGALAPPLPAQRGSSSDLDHLAQLADEVVRARGPQLRARVQARAGAACPSPPARRGRAARAGAGRRPAAARAGASR